MPLSNTPRQNHHKESESHSSPLTRVAAWGTTGLLLLTGCPETRQAAQDILQAIEDGVAEHHEMEKVPCGQIEHDGWYATGQKARACFIIDGEVHLGVQGVATFIGDNMSAHMWWYRPPEVEGDYTDIHGITLATMGLTGTSPTEFGENCFDACATANPKNSPCTP